MPRARATQADMNRAAKAARAKPRFTEEQLATVINDARASGRPFYGLEISPAGEIKLLDSPPHAPQQANEPASVVYFIQCAEFVKIGTTINLSSRLAGLRTSNPYEITLLGTVPGGLARERELHMRFSKYHHRLEWFRLDGDLATWLATEFPA